MEIRSARDLFIHEIQDLYDAEQQLIQALPQVIEMTHSADLKQVVTKQYHETQEQIKKLENLLQEYSIEPLGKHCMGMEGIIEECVEALQDNDRSALLDPIIIGAMQRIKHYEIAGYGTAAAFAKELEYNTALSILIEILEQEKDTDLTLTQLAKKINKNAFHIDEKYLT